MSVDPFPYLRFIRVPAVLEQRIKSSCTSVGATTLISALVIGIVVLFLDGNLMFGKLLQGLGCLFLLFSSAYLLTGRSCVSSGYVNLTIAAQVRRPVFALMIVNAVILALSYVPLLVHLTESTNVSTASIVVGLVLAPVIFGISMMNYRLARTLVPPRPGVLQQYGVSGQVVGPPAGTGPPHQ